MVHLVGSPSLSQVAPIVRVEALGGVACTSVQEVEMDRVRIALAVVAGALLVLLLQPRAADSAPGEDWAPNRRVEYTAVCFVDNPTERRWCERRAEVARTVVECDREETILTCRMANMNVMGQEGWALVRTSEGSYRQWWEPPLFFYERVTWRPPGAQGQ
jgi:hypothetical protein